MKKVNPRPLYLVAVFFIAPSFLFSQSKEWKVEKGRAIIQRSFPLQAKTTSEVYKEVNRWLVKYYRDPEDNLKARIEDEYLRGIGYVSEFLKQGALTSLDLQYSFEISINKDEVIVVLSDIILIHDSPQDVNSNYRFEEYLQSSKGKKNSTEEKGIAEVTNFANSLFHSFQQSVFPVTAKL